MHFIILDLFVLPSFLLPCPPALCNLLAPHILYFYIIILLHHRELTTYTLFITDFFPIFSFSPLGPTGSGLFLKFWLWFDYNYCKYTRFKLLYIDRVQRNISSSSSHYEFLLNFTILSRKCPQDEKILITYHFLGKKKDGLKTQFDIEFLFTALI